MYAENHSPKISGQTYASPAKAVVKTAPTRMREFTIPMPFSRFTYCATFVASAKSPRAPEIFERTVDALRPWTTALAAAAPTRLRPIVVAMYPAYQLYRNVSCSTVPSSKGFAASSVSLTNSLAPCRV